MSRAVMTASTEGLPVKLRMLEEGVLHSYMKLGLTLSHSNTKVGFTHIHSYMKLGLTLIHEAKPRHRHHIINLSPDLGCIIEQCAHERACLKA